MAGFPPPPAGRDHFSELLYLIKNTEYENSQQLQSIEQEREKIARLRTELEDKLRDSEQRERAGTAADEQSEAKEKKLVSLKENCDSLKHTALVLEEHQAALRKKLQLKQEEYQAKRDHHSGLLLKYKGIWEGYEATYKARPLAMEVAHRREAVEGARRKVQDQSEEIVGLERQIASLRLSIGREPPAEVAEWKSPAHIVTEITSLFVGREKAFGQIEQKTSLLNQLSADISALEEKVEKQERPVEKDKTTQQGHEGHQPGPAPNAHTEPLTANTHAPNTEEEDNSLNNGPVSSHPQPPTLLQAPVRQRTPQRQPPPSFLPVGPRARPGASPRAQALSASQFTVHLPCLASPGQVQKQRTALPPTSREHHFTTSTTASRPPQLLKPPSVNRPLQKFTASNFQLVTPPMPKAPPPSGKVGVTSMPQFFNTVATPVARPASPSPQLEVSVFKCPKPVTRTPAHGTEAPTGTMATKQVDPICVQQRRKEREAPTEAPVEGSSSEVRVGNTDSGPPVNTMQQVEALGPAPPPPPLEEASEQASFMDFTAATTEQHEDTEGQMSLPFSFGLSPQAQLQEQLASVPQPVANTQEFSLCPSSTMDHPDTPAAEGSTMAFLFGDGGGGAEGGMGLFDGTSSQQGHEPPADSASSWSLFGADEGGTASSQNESFSFAFGGSPQTPRPEGGGNLSMFQF